MTVHSHECRCSLHSISVAVRHQIATQIIEAELLFLGDATCQCLFCIQPRQSGHEGMSASGFRTISLDESPPSTKEVAILNLVASYFREYNQNTLPSLSTRQLDLTTTSAANCWTAIQTIEANSKLECGETILLVI